MSFGITSPLPIYLGLDGQPLQAGYVLFGVANGNPENTPVAMFWDAALTQPAVQPIRTINGMPSRSGTPSILYTDDDYSVLIKDQYGRQVFYARNSLEFNLAAQLRNAADAGLGAGMIGYNGALNYAASTVGFALNARKSVFATGVAATDDANIQAAINAAPAMSVIDLFGAFASSTAKVLKPQLMLRNGDRASFTHNSTVNNCFEYIPGGTVGFPGQIVFERIAFTGPGAPVSGEALGVYTWGTGKAAIFIDANCPFVTLDRLDVRGFFAGAILRNCYTSTVLQGYYATNRHGIMLFGECNTATLVNVGCDSNTLTGASVNYGGGQTNMQDPTFVSGFFQRTKVGIWLECCQGATGVGTTYFEGNTVHDIFNGFNDGFSPGYQRTANFTRWQGVGSSSPVGTSEAGFTACNISVNHSVDCSFEGLGFYTGEGGPSGTNPNVRVTGGCDRTEIEICFTQSTAPVFADSPERVVTTRSGRRNTTDGNTNALTYGPHFAASPVGRGPYLTSAGTPSGRLSVVLEALADAADVTLRAKAGQGLVRAINSAGAEHFNVDFVNDRINCYRPIVHRVYTVATLPAPSGTIPPGSRAMVNDANATTFNSIVAGGGANTVPVFVDGAGNWRIG